MPTDSSNIQFKYGLKSSYESLSPKDPNTIYFCTDTGEIFLEETPFSPQVLTEMPSDVPENTNTVFNTQVMAQGMQDNFNSCVQEIHSITDNKLVPSSTNLEDNTYATVKDHNWVSQPISGSDYTTNRLRGIGIYDTVELASSASIPEGCFAAILTL